MYQGLIRMVVRVDDAAPRPVRRWVAGAVVADTDDQHLSPNRLETMALLEVIFELVDQRFLDVHHPAANLTNRVVVVAARQLVMRRSVSEVRCINAS